MKQKRTLLLTAVFALVLVGAYLPHHNLSKDTQTDQLVVLPPEGNGQQTQSQQQTEQTESQKQTESTQSQEQTESTESRQQTESTENSEAAANTETQQKPQIQAPNFTVYDATGKPVQLHDFVGKPIVLNFWASWCGPCRSEMPEFQAVSDELAGQVTFLMINAGGESAEDVKAFLDQTGYTFPVYYDTANSAAIAYGVTAFPTTYFLNAKGDVVTYAVGAINKATLLKGISYINP